MKIKHEPIQIIEYENIKNLYTIDKLSTLDIAKRYNSSRYYVERILKLLSVNIRNKSEINKKYKYNENYFDIINTEENSYYLGLLYSDGCNMPYRNEISITLQISDELILLKFNELLQSNRPLTYNYRSKINPKWKDVCTLTINSKHMCKVLNDYGMTPRKSLTKKFPDVILNSSEDIQRHFIRGYFDGNGGIYINKSKVSGNVIGSSIYIHSTKEMCESIKIIIYKNCNIMCNVNKDKRYNTNVYNLQNNTKIGCLNILSWMYKNSTVYIPRKNKVYNILFMDLRRFRLR